MLLIEWTAWVVAGQTKVLLLQLFCKGAQVYFCLKQFHPEKNQIPQLTLLLPDLEMFSPMYKSTTGWAVSLCVSAQQYTFNAYMEG